MKKPVPSKAKRSLAPRPTSPVREAKAGVSHAPAAKSTTPRSKGRVRDRQAPERTDSQQSQRAEKRPRAAAQAAESAQAADVSLPAAALGWTFLTNHSHVLWCLYRDPQMLLREVAQRVGITERMVQRIVAELASAGYLKVEKDGRRNRYVLYPDRPLRHPLEGHCQVGAILKLLQHSG